MSIKISELPEASSVQGSDIVPIVQNGITKKTQASNIKPAVFTGTDGTSAGTSGLVPAPATVDGGKYLNADGTWKAVDFTDYYTKAQTNTLLGGKQDNLTAGTNISIDANNVISSINPDDIKSLEAVNPIIINSSFQSGTYYFSGIKELQVVQTTTSEIHLISGSRRKLLLVNNNGLGAYYVIYDGTTVHYGGTNGTIYAKASFDDYQKLSQKKTVIDENSTDDDYPTAKAVYTLYQALSTAIATNTEAIEGHTTQIGELQTAQTTDEAEITKLQETNELLLDQFPTGNVEGDLIQITDSSSLPFKDVKLYGNTKQVQSTGKNLANTSAGAWEKGSYGSDGTATANSYWARSVNMINSLLGGLSYTLSTQVECRELRLYEYDWTGTFIKYTNAYNTNSLTITTDTNTRFLHWAVTYRNETVGEYGAVAMSQDRLDSLGVMLNTGSTALPFEPYTNGVVEPNPDNPTPIEVVKGDVTVKKTRKNLLKPSVPASGSFLVTLEDDVWVVNGTTTSKTAYFSLFQTIKVKANVPYTFSLIPVENMESNRVQCSIVSNPETQYRSFAGDTDMYTYTLVFPKDIEITVRLFNDRGTEGVERSFDMKFKFQIEEGDTATEYEKYEEDINVVPLGTVNLFNKEEANVQNWLINNSTHVISTSSAERCVVVQVKPNTTYTISKMFTSRFRIGEYPTMPAVGDTLNNYAIGTDTTLTTTTQATTNYMVIHIATILSADLQEVLDSLQIEEGSIAHGYSPYGLEPVELCKIGNYQDKIYKQDGKWWLEKNIQKVILDGTEEEWTSYSKNGDSALAFVGTYTPSNALPTKSYNANTNPLVASNKFKRCAYTDFYNRTVVNGIARFAGTSPQEENQNIHIAVDRNALSSYNLTGFKSWLATNTPILYYVSTPTTTEITDTNLITKLDELLESTTFRNFTNIAVTGTDQIPTFEAIYRKDLETLLNKIELLEARVELLEE